MKTPEPENAIRYQAEYRDSKLYIIVSPTSISFSMENTDQFKTLASLKMLEELFSMLLSENYDLEDIAGTVYLSSMNQNDLPRIINDAIMHYFDRIEPKKITQE